MKNNKVIYDGNVIIDLTSDTVTAEHLEEGYTAHGADGELIVGTMKKRLLDPVEFDYLPGYTASGGVWTYENSTNNRTDIYEIESDRHYLLALGSTVGTRFRSGYAATDPRTISSGTIKGTMVSNVTNPGKNVSVQFTSTLDGYLYVTKDNTGVSGLQTWLIDITFE